MKLQLEKFRIDYVINAVEMNDMKKIREYFEINRDQVNKIITENEWTPMTFACRYANLDMIRLLQDLGFHLDKSLVNNIVHNDDFKVCRHLLRYIDFHPRDVKDHLKYAIKEKKRYFHFIFSLEVPLIDINYFDPANSAIEKRVMYNVCPKSRDDPNIRLIENGSGDTVNPDLVERLESQMPNPDQSAPNQATLANQNKIFALKSISLGRKYLLELAIELSTQREKYGSVPRNTPDVMIEESAVDEILFFLKESPAAKEAVMKYL